MTRRDYIKVAAIIKARGADVDLANDFADLFEEDNERFDRERFLAACGVL